MSEPENYLIDQPLPPILLEQGLRLVGCGTTSDGKAWLKFQNFGTGTIRVVTVLILATSFSYRYTIRERGTGTLLAYQGDHGDPSKDESFIYGTSTQA